MGTDQLRMTLLSRRFLTGSYALRLIFSTVALAPGVCEGTPEEVAGVVLFMASPAMLAARRDE